MSDRRPDRRHRRARPPRRAAGPDASPRPARARFASCRRTPSRPLPFQPVFDAVLLDAPCSGLGTIRRDPDIKWRRTEADLAALARRAAAGSCDQAAASSARRAARLLDLLERARGERRRSSTRSWRRGRTSGLRQPAGAAGAVRGAPRRARPDAHASAPRRTRSVFRGGLGEKPGFAVNFKIHGTYDARLGRGQAAPARRSAGADLRRFCGGVDADRHPRRAKSSSRRWPARP